MTINQLIYQNKLINNKNYFIARDYSFIKWQLQKIYTLIITLTVGFRIRFILIRIPIRLRIRPKIEQIPILFS